MKLPGALIAALLAIFPLDRALLAEGAGQAHTDAARRAAQPAPAFLKSQNFRHYFDSFAATDRELYPGYITNGAAWDFLKHDIPLFECPDRDFESMYYFRWWTYRKHIQRTPEGFIISEFLPPVPWAGKDNSIDCAAGHHFYEGRWLADPRYLDDYSLFWFRKGGEPRRYSFWASDALWERYLVTGDPRLMRELLPDLVGNYEAWTKSQLGDNGLFWQTDDRDGMEVSLGGSGYRPTINSYLYGDAIAIARIAQLAGRPELADEYRAKAARLKRLVQEKLWNAHDQFFEVLPRDEEHLAGVRELLGFTPWYFNLPDPDKSAAWRQLMDPHGFYAPYGLTTAEQRNARFAIAYSGHECQWNGPSWPYATSVTLTALANLLNHYQQKFVSRRDYFDLLRIYTKSQHLRREDGRVVPWIDEDLDPHTGIWIARTLLKERGWSIPERGKDYNHSTYCDLIITGLIGLRPNATDIVEITPLVPAGQWDYFCLDNVPYHGHRLTILYDETGKRWNVGKGLRLFADGKEIARAKHLERLNGKLPD
ncbi:MAG TPA: glycosyl hydrolase family 65 protein [Verrucomicrobiae bacterium]|nr:glycosyl hydrolase family 65 protein [Verrucomicrobiae bacterium]